MFKESICKKCGATYLKLHNSQKFCNECQRKIGLGYSKKICNHCLQTYKPTASRQHFCNECLSKTHIKKCTNCGKEFIGYLHNNFCSISCSTKNAHKNSVHKNTKYKEKKCLECSNTFITSGISQKFCSIECKKVYNEKLKPIKSCLCCEKEFKENRKGQKFCSDSCAGASHGYKGKRYEYVKPSGKVVILGSSYEVKVLDELLKNYSEEDIFVQGEISKELGYTIEYFMPDGSKHPYIPDIYIKSEHKIIEPKSIVYFNLLKEKSLAKQKSCLEQGFKYEFRILDNPKLEKELNILS